MATLWRLSGHSILLRAQLSAHLTDASRDALHSRLSPPLPPPHTWSRLDLPASLLLSPLPLKLLPPLPQRPRLRRFSICRID
jgi:hypothetical protein